MGSDAQTAAGDDQKGALVATLDEQLRIALAAPVLGRYLSVAGPLEGRTLVDLLADPENVRSLRWVLEGVVASATILMLPDGAGELVAEMSRSNLRCWIMVRHRPSPPADPSVGARRIGGRGAELAALEAFISAPAAPSGRSIFFVEGPLGIGKTALLAEFHARCEAIGCLAFMLDARATGPNDSEILAALAPDALPGAPVLATLFETATKLAGRRWVLLIDNIDAWTRQGESSGQLFAHLPESCRIVVAGRRRPKRSWWGETIRNTVRCTVGPLSEMDALRMARTLDMDVVARASGLRRAMGHPLAITRLADTLGREADRDVELLDRIGLEAQGWLTRDLMELSSLPVGITEDLLSDLLDDDARTAARLYDQLTETCMPRPDAVGLVMPEPLRQMLRETLRRRNPGRFTMLQRRLALYYAKRLEEGAAAFAPTVVDDLLDTLVDHPAVTPLFGADAPNLLVRRAAEVDSRRIEAALLELGGKAAVDELLPGITVGLGLSYIVFREETIVAIVHAGPLSAASEMAPGRRRAALQAIRRVTEEAGEVTVIHFIARENGTDRADIRRTLARILFRITLASRGVQAVILNGEAPRRVRLMHGGEALSTEGFHIVIHDLQKLTIRVMVEELLAITPGSLSLLPAQAAGVSFSTEDVRFALTNLDRPELLATSSLVALERCGGDNPAANLQALLKQTLQTMTDTATDRRLAEILTKAYVEKAGKHEQIAIELGMPYGTFRRHLARGLERARELLTLGVSTAAAGAGH